MAQDIIPMDAWDTECPCCGCKLAVDWQLAVYADGGDSPQFVGLRKVVDKVIHNPITGIDYPIQPKVASKGKVRGLWKSR